MATKEMKEKKMGSKRKTNKERERKWDVNENRRKISLKEILKEKRKTEL